MEAASWHTFQVLTKRAGRLRLLLNGELAFAAKLKNVWWGVSVEDRQYGLPRIEQLRQIHCEVRFLSIEPLLEDVGQIDLTNIDWVIVGGESGAGARRMEPQWVHNIHKQCNRAKVRFFFKQWGGVQKSRFGRSLHGRTYDSMPPRQISPIPSKLERLATAARLSDLVLLSTASTD